MAARRSATVRVGIPTLTVAILATGVMIAVNYATADATTGIGAWAIVAAVTLASAAASFWLYRRTQGNQASRDGAAAADPATGSHVQISGNTFNGPTGVQGSGVQNNRFGS